LPPKYIGSVDHYSSDAALAAEFLFLRSKPLRLLRVESVLALGERWFTLRLERAGAERVIQTYTRAFVAEHWLLAEGALGLIVEWIALLEFRVFTEAAKSESLRFLVLLLDCRIWHLAQAEHMLRCYITEAKRGQCDRLLLNDSFHFEFLLFLGLCWDRVHLCTNPGLLAELIKAVHEKTAGVVVERTLGEGHD